jgi:isocitrate/isopropylmalate dehydrogenase
MLLEHLGFGESAARLCRAIEAVYAEGATLTPDQGGDATTIAFCDAVARRLGSG